VACSASVWGGGGRPYSGAGSVGIHLCDLSHAMTSLVERDTATSELLIAVLVARGVDTVPSRQHTAKPEATQVVAFEPFPPFVVLHNAAALG
jgi:hypothetical protein